MTLFLTRRITPSLKHIIVFCLFIVLLHSTTPIGTACIFTQGDKVNCRQYCANYFKTQPQLAWYNITTHQCEPLKICSWVLHYYNYETNECYTDTTMKALGPSEYPASLIEDRIATFYIDNICVNGVPESGTFSDARCYCYWMWENSGKVDMNGYPYKCDQVVRPSKWKGYFLKDLILGTNDTVLMYGQYTPQQLQVVYQQLLEKQASQTAAFVYKYESPLLNLISTNVPQQNLIREHEIVWVVAVLAGIYLVFAFSYLRERSLTVKVTRKQLIRRVQSILEDNGAFQGVK